MVMIFRKLKNETIKRSLENKYQNVPPKITESLKKMANKQKKQFFNQFWKDGTKTRPTFENGMIPIIVSRLKFVGQRDEMLTNGNNLVGFV